MQGRTQRRARPFPPAGSRRGACGHRRTLRSLRPCSVRCHGRDGLAGASSLSVSHPAADQATPRAAVSMVGRQVPALDGVRGIAVAMVMAFHIWRAPLTAPWLVRSRPLLRPLRIPDHRDSLGHVGTYRAGRAHSTSAARCAFSRSTTSSSSRSSSSVRCWAGIIVSTTSPSRPNRSGIGRISATGASRSTTRAPSPFSRTSGVCRSRSSFISSGRSSSGTAHGVAPWQSRSRWS